MRSDFYTSRGTHVYFKDDLENDEIDTERVVAKVESAIPDHLLSELEMIIIGWFDEFEERNINAFYKDGILHVSNIQDNEKDMFDDFVHEIAHSIESPYSYEIYGDHEVRDEFLRKRTLLHDKLWALDYKAPREWFLNTEYDKEFDNFLFSTVGKDKLRLICTGLFISAYAAVSLREYFATGFTDYYLYPNHNFFKKVSPQLYKKLTFLNEIKNLDSAF
jgi:hypothetical protein